VIPRCSEFVIRKSPKLLVNILLFDKNYKLLDATWQQIDGGEQPVGNGTKLPHDYMSAELTAKEAGFAYVYISHENATLVEGYFDDVVMTYTPTNVIQYNEYYPFGLQTANSWTRTTATGNNFLYNEASELNTTSGLYDLPYRTYDPVLGRMNGVDPMASKYGSLTPYNYAANDPVYWTDPSGADMLPFCSTCGGFGIEMQNGLGSNSESSGWGGYGSSGWGNFLGSSAVETSMSWNSSFYGGPDYGQISKDAEAVRSGNMSHQEYGARYGSTIYSNGQFRNGGDGFFYTVSTPYGVNLGYNFGAVVAGANYRGNQRIQQQTDKGPLFIDGMVLNTDNPYRYSPAAYFNYTLTTGEGHLAIYSGNSVRIISIDGKGNLTDRTSKIGPQIDLMKYTSNDGFWQLPRDYSKSSLEEAMGKKYADQFWKVFVNGNGYFMTDRPSAAIGAYLSDSPYSDITFRFRFDVNNYEGHNYNVILNVYYGR
jgi:RHS repeat-associated protein